MSELPTYYLDREDKETRSRILSVKPGKTVQVRVRSEEYPTAKPLVAKGTLNHDSTAFRAALETAQWEHDYDWVALLEWIKAFEEE